MIQLLAAPTALPESCSNYCVDSETLLKTSPDCPLSPVSVARSPSETIPTRSSRPVHDQQPPNLFLLHQPGGFLNVLVFMTEDNVV